MRNAAANRRFGHLPSPPAAELEAVAAGSWPRDAGEHAEGGDRRGARAAVADQVDEARRATVTADSGDRREGVVQGVPEDEIGDVRGDFVVVVGGSIHGSLGGIGTAVEAAVASGQVLAVASLAAFLGGFVGAFAKDMGTVAGKASAEAVREAARRISDHLRKHAGESRRITVDGQEDGLLLVVENVVRLPDLALEKLASMELPDGPARLTWDRANWRWQVSSRAGMAPSRPTEGSGEPPRKLV